MLGRKIEPGRVNLNTPTPVEHHDQWGYSKSIGDGIVLFINQFSGSVFEICTTGKKRNERARGQASVRRSTRHGTKRKFV